MTVLTCASTGQSISLKKQIASSGEGEVWETNLNGYLAKVYHSPNHERVKKLEVMVAHPPKDPNSQINHISFAWPKSLLTTHSGACVGFLMPAIKGGVDLFHVYNPSLRKKKRLEVNWYFLHTTALNVASVIQAIHSSGYVLGDIKPQNILVNNRALASVIDTDSFQVCHPSTGQVYRCLVGSEGFTPVELLGKDFAIADQTEAHDGFRLAVIIYLLLFGDHPFKGKWTGAGDAPEPTELLRRGLWPYASNNLIRLGPNTIPLDIVHPEIQRCFRRCFNDGHNKPHLRPTAAEWYEALQVAIANLSVCGKLNSHYYSQTYNRCYWCERAKDLKVDIFASVSGVAKTPLPPPPLPPIPKIQSSSVTSPQPVPAPPPSPQISRTAVLDIKQLLSGYTNSTSAWVATGVVLLFGLAGFRDWQMSHRDQGVFTKVALAQSFNSPTEDVLTALAQIRDLGLFSLQPKKNTIGWSIWNSHTFKDIDFSADLVKVDGPEDQGFGLIARRSKKQFYYLLISGNSKFVMGKFSQGKWGQKVSSTRDWQHSDAINGGNSSNRLRIVCKGNLIMGWINQQLVGSFRDDSFTAGKIGFASHQGEEQAVTAYVDHVVIKDKVEEDVLVQE